MTTRKLRELLVEAERELNRVEIPRDVDQRLRDRLFRPSRSRAFVWAWALGAICALAVVILWPGQTAQQQLGGFVVNAPSPELRATVRADQTVEIASGSCTLIDNARGEELFVAGPALLRRESDGVRVIAGTAVVTVQPRKPGTPPAAVLVSHGTIEVLGTRFTVVQGADRGSVTLHEGEIRFHDLRGGSLAVAPGEKLEWPQSDPAPVAVEIEEPAPAVPITKSRRTPKPPPAEPIVFRDPEDLLQQVEVLRSRGLFPEAARYLAHGLTTDLRPVARERFSYELGSILTYRLNDRKAACSHWLDHARRYPSGRYQTEVLQASAHAACEGTSR